jgi:hypothetical protein
MQTFRILISDFDTEIQTIDVQWVGRQFRWGAGDVDAGKMQDYLQALADNTRKPPVSCMELAATYAFPEASIEVMNPEDITKADAAPE